MWTWAEKVSPILKSILRFQYSHWNKTKTVKVLGRDKYKVGITPEPVTFSLKHLLCIFMVLTMLSPSNLELNNFLN